jgi:transposase
MARFPPGTGGGEGVAYGRQGQGLLLPSLTAAAGMPLSVDTTPAHGDERAQVLPLLDTLRGRTGTRGRPRKRLKVLAADTGDDAQDLRQRLRRRGSRPQLPQRGWKTKKPRGRPLKRAVPRFQAERTVAWFQRQDRRVVVRWERLAAGFTAFLTIAMMPIWGHRLIVG